MEIYTFKHLFMKTLSEEALDLKIKIHSFPQWFVDIWINEPRRMGFSIVDIKDACIRFKGELVPGFYIVYSYPGGYAIQVTTDSDAENTYDDGAKLYRQMDELVKETRKFSKQKPELITLGELGIHLPH